MGKAGRPTGQANLPLLAYLGSPLNLPLALPEPLILPAPSVWICLLPNLHPVYLHGG